MLQFVSATKQPTAEFELSPLGRSLQRLRRDERIGARIAVNNRRGLSEVYNEAIDAPDAEDVEAFAFIHDDVWILDTGIVERLVEALRVFHVVGVIGNRGFRHTDLRWYDDSVGLSGAVGLGQSPDDFVHYSFGATPAPCVLLDGMFIAARADTLRRTGLRFDPQFRFHFYDLDFCRSAYVRKLRIGTWPIDMIHRPGSRYDTPSWFEARDRYADKWQITSLDPPKGYRPEP